MMNFIAAHKGMEMKMGNDTVTLSRDAYDRLMNFASLVDALSGDDELTKIGVSFLKLRAIDALNKARESSGEASQTKF
jgi:hypothetical protein